MAVLTIKYPLDLTGKSKNNLVTGEVHQLKKLGQKAFTLNYGPFYVESLVLRNIFTGEILKQETQYRATQFMPELTLKSGKDVCTVIAIIDPSLPDDLKVAVDYQLIGGPYTYSTESVQQMIDALSLNNYPINWKQILGKPQSFSPVPHYHDVGDIHGFEYVTAALERLTTASFLSDEARFDALRDYVDRQDNKLQDKIDHNNLLLTNHIADKDNPHDVTKAQVGLSNVDNTADLMKPISTAQQTALDNEANLYDNVTFKSVFSHKLISTADPSQNRITGAMAYRDQSGELQYASDSDVIKEYLHINDASLILAKETITLNAGEKKVYDILQLVGDLITVYNLDSVQTSLTIQVDNPNSNQYGYFIHDSDLARYGISRVNNEVVVRNQYSTTRTFRVFITIGKSRAKAMPVITNVFDNAANLAEALIHLKPPTLKEIFDTWPRFIMSTSYNNDPYGHGNRTNDFFENPNNAYGHAATWYWDNNHGRAVQKPNSPFLTGFVSKNKYDTYVNEATVSSTGRDDDWNGLVIAHKFLNNRNYVLMLIITPKGYGPNINGAGYPYSAYIKIYDGTHNTFLATANIPIKTDPSIGGGWSGRYRRLGVERDGDEIKIKLSNWNSTIFNDKYSFTFNLNDREDLKSFKGPQSYGYCNLSQDNSTFYDVFFNAGERNQELVDLVNNKIYTYVPSIGWQYIPGLTPQGLFGAPRKLIDKEKNKQWMLNVDGTWTPLY